MANTPDIAGQAQGVFENSYQPQITISFPTNEIESLAADISSLKGVVDEMLTLQVDKFADVAEGVIKIAKSTPLMNGKLESIDNEVKKFNGRR